MCHPLDGRTAVADVASGIQLPLECAGAEFTKMASQGDAGEKLSLMVSA
jgi:hypothetical protein